MHSTDKAMKKPDVPSGLPSSKPVHVISFKKFPVMTLHPNFCKSDWMVYPSCKEITVK